MNSLEIIAIGRDLMMTTMLLVAPPVIVSVLVGVSVSIFQTVTSIQDQTLSFAPRIIAVGVAMLVCLPWTVHIASAFTYRMLERLPQVVQ